MQVLNIENVFLDNDVASSFAIGATFSSFVQDERLERQANRYHEYCLGTRDRRSIELEYNFNFIVNLIAELYGSKERKLSTA